MRNLTWFLFASAIAAAAAAAPACSPYDPSLGDAPYLCAATEPACPSGYTCQTTQMPAPRDRICVSENGLTVDSMSGFPCADDSSLEGGTRNDTPMTAYQTPVDSQRLDLTLAGLAICPEADKDNYAITISAANAMKAIEVVVSWDNGQPLSTSILNAGGTSIGNGVAMGDKMLRACVPNMPAGTYYASVFATGSTRNNYRMSIKLLANCQ
jgi:hypothetical protein